jgi:hypothetical protein
MPTFAGREVWCHQQAQWVPTAVNLDLLDRSRYFSFIWLLSDQHEAEWTPFQPHNFSENLVELLIDSGISGSVAKNFDH